MFRFQAIPTQTDPRETTDGYRPPRSAEDHEWWALAIKSAAALVVAVGACRGIGLTGVTTAIIAAAFLVAAPPVATLWTTAYRIGGMIVGTAFGAIGAVWGLSNDGTIPIAFFLVFGAIVGILASRKADLTYTAVIGAVVAATGASGRQSVEAVVLDTSAQLLVGSFASISTVWIFEKTRAEISARCR